MRIDVQHLSFYFILYYTPWEADSQSTQISSFAYVVSLMSTTSTVCLRWPVTLLNIQNKHLLAGSKMKNKINNPSFSLV